MTCPRSPPHFDICFLQPLLSISPNSKTPPPRLVVCIHAPTLRAIAMQALPRPRTHLVASSIIISPNMPLGFACPWHRQLMRRLCLWIPDFRGFNPDVQSVDRASLLFYHVPVVFGSLRLPQVAVSMLAWKDPGKYSSVNFDSILITERLRMDLNCRTCQLQTLQAEEILPCSVGDS